MWTEKWGEYDEDSECIVKMTYTRLEMNEGLLSWVCIISIERILYRRRCVILSPWRRD